MTSFESFRGLLIRAECGEKKAFDLLESKYNSQQIYELFECFITSSSIRSICSVELKRGCYDNNGINIDQTTHHGIGAMAAFFLAKCRLESLLKECDIEENFNSMACVMADVAVSLAAGEAHLIASYYEDEKKHLSKGGKSRGKQRKDTAKPLHDEIKEKASEIRMANKNLSINRVAEILKIKYGADYSIPWISQIIKDELICPDSQ